MARLRTRSLGLDVPDIYESEGSGEEDSISIGYRASAGGDGRRQQQQQRLSSSTESHRTPNSMYGRSIRGWTLLLYAADWLIVLVATAVSQIILIPRTWTISFIVTNPDIQQRYNPDTFNLDRAAVVLCTAIPIIVMFVWLGCFKHPFRDIHHVALGLCMALSFAALFTSILKQMCAILSHDFIDRCKPHPDVLQSAFATGRPLTARDCTGDRMLRGLHFYPSYPAVIPACAGSYLGLFASHQLGLLLHPEVRRQIRQVAPCRLTNSNHPGQAVVSFISILPVAGGMAFPAVEARNFGGGSGWGYGCSVLLGFAFGLWGHIIYCCGMPSAAVHFGRKT
ncbi:hypothetical protein H4R18_004541 [Coemansia javaensis]|uniref:Uncharacterized protein n=1 Tax=Coemansia javaensis TaxID=2761396 RepID=A0A9W8HBY5_9FUNG|nr:hypothetical protein H4R18_004541 [Coemansia javaensis]